MAQPLSYEDPSEVVLITSRTLLSQLWFINNPKLWEKVLGYLAKYAETYGVILYGFIIMGNHYHLIARFPRANRAKFMRSFKAMFAKLVPEYVPECPGGKIWARRYAWQVLPREADILYRFFYVALNPVSSGLHRDPDKYYTYNSFHNAIHGIEAQYVVFDRMGYNERLRFDQSAKKKDFMSTHTLKFARLPGFEHLGKDEYAKQLKVLKREKIAEAIEKRMASGKGFADPESLTKIRPGSMPHSTKRSKRYSFRPLVLTFCKETRKLFLEKYFTLLRAFREASRRYLGGDLNVIFPLGTYPPCRVATA